MFALITSKNLTRHAQLHVLVQILVVFKSLATHWTFLSRPLNAFPPSEVCMLGFRCLIAPPQTWWVALITCAGWVHMVQVWGHVGSELELSSQFGHGHFFFWRSFALINLTPSFSSGEKKIHRRRLVGALSVSIYAGKHPGWFWSVACVAEPPCPKLVSMYPSWTVDAQVSLRLLRRADTIRLL